MPTIETHPGVAYSVVGDVVLIVWTGEPTLAANRWLVTSVAATRLTRSPPKLVVQIIAESAGTPDAEARRYVQEAFKVELGKVRRLINAPLGSSFKQSLVRTILRGMALVGDRNKVMVIAATLAQALALVAEASSPETPSPAELRAEIERLFTAQGASVPQ